MTTYPTPHLNQVPEEPSVGVSTPSHGGTVVGGQEFDLPIAQSQQQQQQQSSSSNNTTAISSLSQQPRSAQLPTSRDQLQPLPAPPVPRSGTSSRPRPVSMPPQAYNTTAAAASNGSTDKERPVEEPKQRHASSSGKSRSTNRILGDYTLSKTLGAGSMGKVKLATHNVTGEKLAVKILPRVYPYPVNTNGTTPEAVAKQASKDASKEIRTLREAALSMLLHHPYICGMREMIVHQHHYYMVFEYVNGGQMLDYIISHGRLRERVARKFARQIGSALDYCHRNNVVHRDLKIENILISQTGNIKIIDFGLSNLYDPIGHLSTFCGSLYFAAPELLNAKIYTGPEVDVWSFGVVLYVLVCGKVPFDDQSMPALHAKIKRGLVEYPVWLSAECKHLLSRMLVTNPSARAPLSEVLSHPWILRGFPGPPESHLVHREPLRSDELDKQVLRGMKGFEFGPDEDIERKLVQVLESESYIRAVQAWERKRDGGRNGHSRWGAGESVSNSSLAISFDGNHKVVDSPVSPTKQKSRRFSGFDFYRRKLFSPASSPPGSPFSGNSPPNSQSHLNSRSLGDSNREPVDPTRGFNPLISMYYLAREKLERERVYGPGVFASSQLSIQGNAEAAETTLNDASVPPSSYVKPAQLSPVKKELPNSKVDYGMALPHLPAPETSHQSGMSYDANPTTPSPTTPNHPQPRARDAGLPVPKLKQPEVAAGGTLPPSSAKTSLPRAPPASTHRRSHSLSQRPTMLGGRLGGVFGEKNTVDEHGALAKEIPHTAGPEVSAFTEKMPRSSNDGSLSAPMAAGATLVKKFGSLLGARGGDDSKRHGGHKRLTIVGGLTSSPRPSDAENEKISTEHANEVGKRSQEKKGNEKTMEDENTRNRALSHSQSQQPVGSIHRRAATILDPQSRTARHERRSSTGGALLPTAGGTIGRHRRPSTGYGASTRPMGGTFGRTEEEEETKAQGQSDAGVLTGNGETYGQESERHVSEKDFKPVFLKGLFSVATTSTKPPPVIKTDIKRVLDRMQVQYRETKGGFECIHLPSIDVTSVHEPPPTPIRGHRKQGSSGSNDPPTPRRSIAKKTSKLSFGLSNRDRPKTADKEKEKDKELPSRPSGTITLATSPSSGSSSFFNVSSHTHTVLADATRSTELNGVAAAHSPIDESPSRTQTPANAKILPPIPRDFARAISPAPPTPLPTGEVDKDMFETISANTLAVRFEINIVKVPWLPLHGIQFRRASGDGWQYQMLARRVLTELKL